MEAVQVMQFVCLIVTLLMFSTGIIPCMKMYKSGSTKNVPYEIFVLSIIGCGGMFHYGLRINNPTISFINGFGLFLQVCYVLTYLSCVKSKSYPLALLLSCLVYLAALYSYLYYGVSDFTRRTDILGTASSLATTVILCLPALEIVQNVRHQNADGIPLVMLVSGSVCSSSWLVYGMLLNDPNIYMPNFPALLINAVKFYLISLYGQSAEKTKTN